MWSQIGPHYTDQWHIVLLNASPLILILIGIIMLLIGVLHQDCPCGQARCEFLGDHSLLLVSQDSHGLHDPRPSGHAVAVDFRGEVIYRVIFWYNGYLP